MASVVGGKVQCGRWTKRIWTKAAHHIYGYT